MEPADHAELHTIAQSARRDVLRMVYEAKGSHLGCSFSCMEILVSLYWNILRINPGNPQEANRDRFILSKGHGVAALYAVLARRGFFGQEELDRYTRDGSRLAGHAVLNTAIGVEASTGSGGHGLSLGLGMAIAAERRRDESRIFILMGDGEITEGSVWEAIAYAGFHRISNVTLIIDRNRLQIFGRTDQVLDMEPLRDKFTAFGWDSEEIDGHDFSALHAALGIRSAKPRAVIAETLKGKGVSFMEGKAEWHGKHPDESQYQAAMKELSG